MATTIDTQREGTAPVAGRWHNRLGSVMELAVGPDDAITGWYRSAVGTPHPGGSYRVTGYVLEDALGFCVDFRPHGSVAAWVGHHVEDGAGERLVTLWHLAQPVDHPRDDADLWRSVLAGSDEFEREA